MCSAASSSLRILQLTDIHQFPLGATVWDNAAKGRVISFEQGGYSTTAGPALVQRLVDQVMPDLVVFTGDIVDGRPFAGAGRNAWVAPFQSLVEPLQKTVPPTPWTFCPGNHDDDGAPWDRADLLQVFKLGGCFPRGAQTFNFTFSVGATREPHAETSLRLWVVDSGGNNPVTKYDPVAPTVVDSFRELSRAGVLPATKHSLMYFHIPLPEYGGLAEVAGHQGLFDAAVNSGAAPSVTQWRIVAWMVKAFGFHRVVGCSTVNTGLFDAIAASGTKVRATFCGHDHANDFVALRKGVYLCYGRVSSFTPPSDWEGDAGPLPFLPGGRVVEFIQGAKDQLNTWVETEQGMDVGSRVVMEVNQTNDSG